jgi:hypothetical protein
VSLSDDEKREIERVAESLSQHQRDHHEAGKVACPVCAVAAHRLRALLPREETLEDLVETLLNTKVEHFDKWNFKIVISGNEYEALRAALARRREEQGGA